jgi:capsular polysaccharide biosynthesis protein
MTLAEQMTLFGQTRYCVAVHGAGLTNMIFRREQPMNLIEIFPPTSQPDYYPRLAHAYGFRHYSLIGTDPVRTDKGHDTPFRLSPELLQKSIDEMFQNDPDVLTV